MWNSTDQTVISVRDYLGVCDWGAALFPEMGWPVGTAVSSLEAGKLFVRDPEGTFAGMTGDRFDARADLPADAVNTGFHRGVWELWVSPSHGDTAVFLVNGDRVERWPLLPTAPACSP